jgi:hypothetical protein
MNCYSHAGAYGAVLALMTHGMCVAEKSDRHVAVDSTVCWCGQSCSFRTACKIYLPVLLFTLACSNISIDADFVRLVRLYCLTQRPVDVLTYSLSGSS